jgi:probable F420-dependent oxidoreductase
MSSKRPFRFGVIVLATAREDLVAKAQKAEALGYATLLMPDHLGQQFSSPLLALQTVAEVTTTLRLGTFVLANDFRYPVILAKEAATLDVLSGGRFELGLGAGWLRAEYEQAGIPFASPGVRVARLEESVSIVKALFAEEPVNFTGKYYTVTDFQGSPMPVQRPHPPVLLAGAGKRILSLAAREADIVGLTIKSPADGSGWDVLDGLPEATEQKIALLRQAAGERFAHLELNSIAFQASVTENRQQVAEQFAQRAENRVTWEQLLESPHVLIGTVNQICEDILANRERYGISYVAIFEQSMEEFAPVVARLAGK